MPRTSRAPDGTVVPLHAPRGDSSGEAKVVGYDSTASRYIVELSSGEQRKIARSQFDISETPADVPPVASSSTESRGRQAEDSLKDETPDEYIVQRQSEARSGAAETRESHRCQADPNNPAYQKDPEKFYYERGYADGKRGHNFNEQFAAEHPRYTRGFAKHRDVPEAFRHQLDRKKAEEPAAELVSA